MAKYALFASFKGEPECRMCILDRYAGENEEGEIRKCQGLAMVSICPKEGCRKDCPLVEMEGEG